MRPRCTQEIDSIAFVLPSPVTVASGQTQSSNRTDNNSSGSLSTRTRELLERAVIEFNKMGYLPGSTTTKMMKSVSSSPKSGTMSRRLVSIDEKYAKHRKQKSSEHLKLILSIFLVTLSLLALWHFGGATQKRVRSSFKLRRSDKNHPPHHGVHHHQHDILSNENSHHDNMQTLHKNKKDETSSSSNSNSNNNMKLDEEIQDHMRDVSMARKIEELKQFQEKVHENPEEFEQDIQEQIEAESQLIEEEGGE